MLFTYTMNVVILLFCLIKDEIDLNYFDEIDLNDLCHILCNSEISHECLPD